MRPIFITIAKDLNLRIIPDSVAHLDGHPVLTYSYSIYVDSNRNKNVELRKEEKLQLEKKDDPDYRGEIIFEKPGQLFNYIASDNRLSADEIQELLEKLTEHREDSSHWSFPEGR